MISSGSICSYEKMNDDNLYLKLLYAYLRALVPMDELNAHHKIYRISLLDYLPICWLCFTWEMKLKKANQALEYNCSCLFLELIVELP
ncbi:Geranylgeranyl transferase type-2 subunit beta [Bienertia sinuspersici]